MSEHEQPQMAFIGPDGTPMTLEDVRAEQDRAQAQSEAFWADWRRLIFDELAEDQISTLRQVLKHMADGAPDHSVRLANYFEGMAAGALHVKQASQPLFFEDEEQAPGDGSTLWSHPFGFGNGTGQCTYPQCGLPPQTRPHLRWDSDLRGDGSDGVDV